MNDEQDKALQKVRKLLQRAADQTGSHENEREMAMRQAHAILAKHNLSMAQAEQAGKEKGESRVDKSFEVRSFQWARWISKGIAELFFCKMFTVKMQSGKEQHVFIGRESNAITAREMSEYLIKSVLSERERRARVEGAHDPNPWKLAFAQGAAITIHTRCTTMKRESETKDVVVQDKIEGAGFMLPEKREPGTALVLAGHYEKEEQENSDYLKNKLGIKLTKAKAQHRGNRGSGEAYGAGKEYGQGVSLNQQLGDKSSSRRLIK